jgi:hypothetical protein
VTATRNWLFLTAMLAASFAFARDTSCSQTQSAEARVACLDQQAKQQSHCSSLRDSDSKNLCMAQLKQQKSYCFSIRSPDLKTICFDEFK